MKSVKVGGNRGAGRGDESTKQLIQVIKVLSIIYIYMDYIGYIDYIGLYSIDFRLYRFSSMLCLFWGHLVADSIDHGLYCCT